MGIKQRTVCEGGRVYNDWLQPERGLILAENAQVRNERSARKLDWAWPQLRIPELDLKLLKLKYPALSSRDGVERRTAWLKFLNSTESAPYRIMARGRTLGRSFGGS